MTDSLLLGVPLIPLATRCLMCVGWYWQMQTVLGEQAQDRDFARTTILSLAGFAFTAVAGLSVVSDGKNPNLELAVWYVTTSFIAYICSLNLQAYKATRWQNQIAQGLVEAGNLALLAALVAMIQGTDFSSRMKLLVVLFASSAWLTDHVIRLLIDMRYLSALRRDGSN